MELMDNCSLCSIIYSSSCSSEAVREAKTLNFYKLYFAYFELKNPLIIQHELRVSVSEVEETLQELCQAEAREEVGVVVRVWAVPVHEVVGVSGPRTVPVRRAEVVVIVTKVILILILPATKEESLLGCEVEHIVKIPVAITSWINRWDR